MRLLIIGGGAFLGKHIAMAGLSRGHSVTLFNRGTHATPPGTEFVRGDRRTDLEMIRGRRWDAVVDTCGFLPAHVRATAQVLRDLVDHYTFISSLSVYSDAPDEEMIDESSDVEPLAPGRLRAWESDPSTASTQGKDYGDAYGPLKALCERAAIDEMDGRVLSVRAGLLVGPDDHTERFAYWPRRIWAGGEVLAPGCPEQQIQLIDARDVADWVILMVERKETGTYNATGPKFQLTIGDLLARCSMCSGAKCSLTWVSDAFLLKAGVAPWSELPLWLPASLPAAAMRNCSSARAKHLGLRYRTLETTVVDTLRWDREQRRPLSNVLTAQREAEILRAWSLREAVHTEQE